MKEFFYMGGYGYYVWGAYGLCFLVLALNVAAARKRNRRIKREVIKFAGNEE